MHILTESGKIDYVNIKEREIMLKKPKINTVIRNGKLDIYFDGEIESLEKQIEELKKTKELILTSSTYLLLDGKTQMLDENDEIKVRSRLEHTNNVAFIAKAIVSNIYEEFNISNKIDKEVFILNKRKEELYAEVMALGHDLGHTPFGHSGETILNEFVKSIEDKNEIRGMLENRKRCFGEEYEREQGHTKDFLGKLSFEHNEQSAIEFSKLIHGSDIDLENIDTNRIIKGILAHSISRVPETPSDLIAQIVRQTDKIEYRNKDYSEIMRFIKIGNADKDIHEYLQLSESERINKIVKDISTEAIQKGKIEDNNESMEITKRSRKIYEQVIYFLDDTGKRGLITGENRERNQMIYKKLLEYYYRHPEKIPTKVMKYNDPINSSKKKERVISYDKTRQRNYSEAEQVVSFVNTFTNEKCKTQYRKLIKERIIKGKRYGINPITQMEIEERKNIQLEEEMNKVRAIDIEESSNSYSADERLGRLHNKNFMNTYLTDKAKKEIQENERKHQEENQIDIALWKEVKEIDAIRNKQKDSNKAIDR